MPKKLTNSEIEQRAKERKAELIEKCRYYKDEYDNPWEYCYHPTLVFRKNMWDLEKEWVKALSISYRCDIAKHDFLDSLHLTEYVKSLDLPISLMNHILLWAKGQADKENTAFRTSDAAKYVEEYIKRTPLARDYRMYFAFYMGEEYEEEESAKYMHTEETYLCMGYSQEFLMRRGRHEMFSDWYYADMAKEHRGEEGIWGWYADTKFPSLQKDVVFFTCCNWGQWCPYDDVDALAEQYLYYHYPGDDKLKGTEYGSVLGEDDILRNNCETAAEEMSRKEFGKDVDVELYMMYKDHCYFRPLLCYLEQKKYKYPVLIKVDYAKYKAEVLCSEETVTIDEKIQEYIHNYAIEQYCVFYKGEEANPFSEDDWKHFQWNIERMWVWSEAGEPRWGNPHIMEFIMDFPDTLPFDPRPTSFKAFLYNYLTRWDASYPGVKEEYRDKIKALSEKITEYQQEHARQL